MATNRPRITITLTDKSHDVLRRLSAVNGDSMSRIITDLVDTVLPSLERVVGIAERAESALPEVHEKLARNAAIVNVAMEEALDGSVGKLTEVLDMLDASLDGEGGRPSDPLASNQGGQNLGLSVKEL